MLVILDNAYIDLSKCKRFYIGYSNTTVMLICVYECVTNYEEDFEHTDAWDLHNFPEDIVEEKKLMKCIEFFRKKLNTFILEQHSIFTLGEYPE